MMHYSHRFRVRSSLADVAEFHSRAASMPAITPPPIIVKVHHALPILANGDSMDFTLWVGPLPIHWLARIEAVSATGFSDRQMRGPFEEWIHRHTYEVVDGKVTDVIDEITLKIKRHPLWALVGMGMRLGLPILFAYRAWKTKRILQ